MDRVASTSLEERSTSRRFSAPEHLATPDGRLTAAINRLMLLPPRPSRGEQADYERVDTRPPVEHAFGGEQICSRSSAFAWSSGLSGKHSNS